MMLLMWLMLFDNRWALKVRIPSSAYLLLLAVKVGQIIVTNDQFRNVLLIIQAVLTIKLYTSTQLMKQQKKISQYKDPGIRYMITQEINKKVLLSQSGKFVFLTSLLDLYWIKEELLTVISTLPIIIIIFGFIFMKVGSIILSWAFPLVYIKLKRKQI